MIEPNPNGAPHRIFDNDRKNKDVFYPDSNQFSIFINPERKTATIGTSDVSALKSNIITNESPDDLKAAYLEQVHHLAKMEDIMRDAATWIKNDQINPQEKELLIKLLQDMRQNISALENLFALLKKNYPVLNMNLMDSTSFTNNTTPNQDTINDAAIEKDKRAKKYVLDYLFGDTDGFREPRIIWNSKSGLIELSRYQFKANATDPQLDTEELTKGSNEYDFNPKSALQRTYADLPSLIRSLQPVLEREIVQFLLQQDLTNAKAKDVKSMVESQCLNIVGTILNGMQRTHEGSTLTTPKDSLDHRGIVLAVLALRDEAVQNSKLKDKAAKFGLPSPTYLDPQVVPKDVFQDPKFIADLRALYPSTNSLLEKIAANPSAVEELYAPIKTYALRALEKFVDPEGKIVNFLTASEIEVKFSQMVEEILDDPFGMIKEAIADILSLTKYETAEVDRANYQKDLAAFQRDISIFLNSINPSFQTLSDVREHKDFFGRVTNIEDVRLAKDLIARETELSRRLQSNRTVLDTPTSKRRSRSLDDLRNELKVRILAREKNPIDFKIPALQEVFAHPNDIPHLEIMLGVGVFSSIELDPLETLEKRLRERVAQRSQEIAVEVSEATDKAITILTKALGKTDAVLTQVMGSQTEKSMTAAVLGYMSGSIYDSEPGELSIFGVDERTFFHAAQEIRRSQSNIHNLPTIAPAILNKVNIIKLLVQ